MLANMCLPTLFKKLANILCWPAVLAIYERVRSLLANKRQTVRCDWLAVVNIMVAEWVDASCVDYTNYTSPFYLCIIDDCTQTDFGHLRFCLYYEQLNKSLLQQRHRRLLSPPSPPYLTLVQQNVVVCDTNVGQQLLANICWSCVCGL